MLASEEQWMFKEMVCFRAEELNKKISNATHNIMDTGREVMARIAKWRKRKKIVGSEEERQARKKIEDSVFSLGSFQAETNHKKKVLQWTHCKTELACRNSTTSIHTAAHQESSSLHITFIKSRANTRLM